MPQSNVTELARLVRQQQTAPGSIFVPWHDGPNLTWRDGRRADGSLLRTLYRQPGDVLLFTQDDLPSMDDQTVYNTCMA